ncbi:uncharacterized protein LJ206_016765 [Theristicus caerulescens]
MLCKRMDTHRFPSVTDLKKSLKIWPEWHLPDSAAYLKQKLQQMQTVPLPLKKRPSYLEQKRKHRRRKLQKPSRVWAARGFLEEARGIPKSYTQQRTLKVWKKRFLRPVGIGIWVIMMS